jgi:malate synthase
MHHRVPLADGKPVTVERFRQVLAEEMKRIEAEGARERYGAERLEEARVLFEKLSTAPRFEDFLTLPAYEALVSHD